MATTQLTNSLEVTNAVKAEIATVTFNTSVSERVMSGEFQVPSYTYNLASLLVTTKAMLDALPVEEVLIP